MKVARNVEEFYRLNDTDVTKLICKHFNNIITRHSLEDIKNEIYERLLLKGYIEQYRPFRVYIDEETNTWTFKKAEAKFSTYIFTFMKNYILAYYGNRKPYENWLSLDEYNDSGYSEDSERKLPYKEEDLVYDSKNDFRIDVDKALKKLKKKTKNKGTLVCDTELELSIAKCLENYGEKGCSEEEFFKIIFNKEEGVSNLETMLFQNIVKELEEKKFLKIEEIVEEEKNDQGKVINKKVIDRVYILDEPLRRSLYKLFSYYLQGYKDKEISEKFNMTVAGVGALKRSLRKELQHLAKQWKTGV